MSYEKEDLLSGQGEPPEVDLSGQGGPTEVGLSGQEEPTQVDLSGPCGLLGQVDLLGEAKLSRQGELTDVPTSVLKSDPDIIVCRKSNGGLNADGGFQGVIRLNNLQGLSRAGNIQSTTSKKAHKRRFRWLCQQFGFPSKCKRQDNFLNLTEEEIQRIKSRQGILMMKKEAQFREMFSSYITGIIGDEGIMKDMNEVVAKHDYRMAKKKLELYQNWHRQVFESIKGQLEKKLKALTSDQIKEKLRYFHYQYMNASNQRLLFLDVLDHNFYNPFESLKFSIKYKNILCDPVKHDLNKENYEKLIKGEIVAKCALTRETLDASKWPLTAFRSTIWGHLNADEEDGSEVRVKKLEKWISHDLLYNSTFVDEKYWEQEFPRGKHIVPNQGKGWSFQTRKGGKAKVYGLEFMTQPKLQLYY